MGFFDEKDLLPEHELPLNELSYPGTRHDLKEIIFKGSEVLWFYSPWTG